MLKRVRAAQSQVPNILLCRGTRNRMQHISSQPTNPPASGIMCFRTNGKHSIDRPASWFGLTFLQEPCGPVTSKYYANTKPWHNWVTFCSGSNCYCKCIFIRSIPVSSVSQISVKSTRIHQHSSMPSKGARITNRRLLTSKSLGAHERGREVGRHGVYPRACV